MSKTASRTCPSCGARLSDDAEVCDLCGTFVVPGGEAPEVVAAPAPVSAVEPPPSTPAPDAGEEQPAMNPSGVHCNQCGWRNPVGARFCSMCGAGLQEVAAPSPAPGPPAATPPSVRPAPPPLDPAPPASKGGDAPVDERSLTRQIGIIVGAGVLLVVVLFMVTAVSKDRPAPVQTAAQTPAQADPASAMPAPAAALDAGSLPALSPALAEEVGPIEAEIEQLAGDARVARQRDLISLYLNAGRLDYAALRQRDIAEALDATEEWKRAGDLFYDWMRAREEQGQRDPAIAQQAIDAYQKVLAVEPNNLDVRTDMATAYLSSNNAMQGVTEIQQVLSMDPNHVHALFNYGIMLSMIGRTDQALEQFEKIKSMVGADSPYFGQADEAIRAIRQTGAP